MADGVIQVPVDGAGKKIDSSELTVGAQTVERQRIVIASDSTAANLAAVSAAGRLSVDASGVAVPVTDNGGSLTVDGTVTITPSGTQTVSGTVTANAGTGPFPVSDNAGSLTVDNGGTFAVQDSQVIVDNAGFTDGTSKVFPIGLIYDEVAGTALTENDIGASRMNANRATVSTIEDGATRARYATVTAANALKTDGSAVTQPVSGTFWQATQPVSGTFWQATQPVSGTVTANAGTGTMAVDSELPAAAALADATANPTTPLVGAGALLFNGTTWDRVRGDITNGIDVDVTRVQGNVAVTGTFWQATQPVSGTFWQATQPVSGTVTASNTSGDVASGSADSGNPIKVGGVARSADITNLTAGNRANTMMDLQGRQIVFLYSVPENTVYGATAAITTTSSTQVIAAGAAGVRNYINCLTVINSHATVDTVVEIRDGATTVMHRGFAKAAGGGYTITFPSPLRGTAATAVNAFAITTGSNVYVSASGFISNE